MTKDKILAYFNEILQIPRESGKEQQINLYLKKFAEKHELEFKIDEIGNVLITKEASSGREDSPTIILQSHSDMVCEKNADSNHDFSKDPIKTIIENNWLIAKDTTLGADCGIGMAAQLALLADDEITHGKIEALFTVSEETGLDGAFALKNDFLTGSILLNLDSEDEGELFIGCAGGLDTTGKFKHELVEKNAEYQTYNIGFKGCLGGHSGDDIEKGRANAVQLLVRTIYKIQTKFDIDICFIDGGNKRNAIAREANAIIAINPRDYEEIGIIYNKTVNEIKLEFESSDPYIYAFFEEQKWDGFAIDKKTARNLILCLNTMPHGVLSMSCDMAGLVETSTNLASIKMLEENIIRIGTSQRSSINSAKFYIGERIESAFLLAGAEISHESEYPGWKPQLNSNILEVAKASYKKLFGNEPIVRAIHAGLECGLFLDKYPNLDMISFGPTIKGAHAPGEKLDLATLDKFSLLLEEIIINTK